MSKQKAHMWGCWIVWESSNPSWMWDTTAQNDAGERYYPLVFTETRRKIRPLVREMRSWHHVKSAKAVKVLLPEGPK